MLSKDFSNYSHTRLVIILLALSYLFLMAGNGVLSLTHPDEVFYIQSAKEMLSQNSWDTPYIFDAPQFEKPIFSYWMFMAAIKIFGLNSFAGRFAPALFGILAVPLIYMLTWLLFKNKRLSFLAGIILMSSFIHLALSRAVLTDMIFSVWVAASLTAFYWAYITPKFKDAGLVLCFILSGVAVLTKGLLGFCFPAGTILIFLVLRRDVKFLLSPGTFAGLVFGAAIAVPWHMEMWRRYDGGFTAEYFRNVHIRRIIEAEHERSNRWYFYPMTILGGVMPWTVFLIPAFGQFVKNLKEKSLLSLPFLFLLSWMIGIFIFVQPAASKLASYILPIFPAFIALLAFYLDSVLGEGQRSKAFYRCAGSFAGILAIIIIPLIIASVRFKRYLPTPWPVYLLAVLFLSLAFGVFWNLKKKNASAILAIFPMITGSLLIVATFAIPIAEPYVSCKPVCDELTAIDKSKTVILSSKFFVRGVRYYTDRPVAVIDINGRQFFSPHPIVFLNTPEKVRDFLSQRPVTFCILKKGNVEDVERIAAQNGFIFSRLSVSGDKFLVKIERPAKAVGYQS